MQIKIIGQKPVKVKEVELPRVILHKEEEGKNSKLEFNKEALKLFKDGLKRSFNLVQLEEFQVFLLALNCSNEENVVTSDNGVFSNKKKNSEFRNEILSVNSIPSDENIVLNMIKSEKLESNSLFVDTFGENATYYFLLVSTGKVSEKELQQFKENIEYAIFNKEEYSVGVFEEANIENFLENSRFGSTSAMNAEIIGTL